MHPEEIPTTSVTSTEDIGQVLRMLRRRQARRGRHPELTYRELARLTGWAHSAIGQYLSGKVLPPTDRFDELIRLLGATPTELRTLATARDRLEEERRPARPVPPAPPEARPVIPRQLPADLAAFAGRSDVLARLNELLATDSSRTAVVTSTLSGTAGVGKTTLAVHWAHSVAEQFPDGQLYVNMRGFDPDAPPMPAEQALRGFIEALGVSARRIPTDFDAQVRLYRSLMAERRAVVVLDNVATAEQARPLLPGAPHCRVVVTSRNQLASLIALEAAQPVAVDLLTVDEARELLARRLGYERVAAEPASVEALIASCARLPLALAVVAAQVTLQPHLRLADIAEELRTTPRRLPALRSGDTATDMRAVFSWSYRRLSGGAARLFRLLALHPGPDLSLPAASSLAADTPEHTWPQLRELIEAHLLAEQSPGRYACHDLLRLYAAELARTVDGTESCQAAQRRLFDHYLHTAYAAALVLFPDRSPPITLAAAGQGVTTEPARDRDQVLSWFDAERAVLLAVLRQAAATGSVVHFWQLTWCLTDFLDRTGLWQDWVSTHRRALTATQDLGDRWAEAMMHVLLGTGLLRLSRTAEAGHHQRRALALWSELDDASGQARAHRDLGWTAEHEGRLHAALTHCREAAELYLRVGDKPGHARSLSAIGWYHSLLGEHREAVELCLQALPIIQEVGSLESEAGTWHSLGHAYHRLGAHDQAVDAYHRAIRLCRSLGARFQEAEMLGALADVHRDAGDAARADECLRRAVDILDSIGPDATQLRANLQQRQRPAR